MGIQDDDTPRVMTAEMSREAQRKADEQMHRPALTRLAAAAEEVGHLIFLLAQLQMYLSRLARELAAGRLKGWELMRDEHTVELQKQYEACRKVLEELEVLVGWSLP